MPSYRLNPHARRLTFAARVLMAGGPKALACAVDARIEAAARRNCSHLTLLHHAPIAFLCTRGWVTIHGKVDHAHHRLLAELAVSSLPGVRGVANRLAVATLPSGRGRAAWASLKVKAALTFRKTLDRVTHLLALTDR